MSASARDERRLQRIESFKKATHPSSEWQYNFRDVILYALSIGCRRTEREFVYENDCDFATLPSFAVVAVHLARLQYQDLLPNFDPVCVCFILCVSSWLASYALYAAMCCAMNNLFVIVETLKASFCSAENAAAWGTICGNLLSTADQWQICRQTQPH